MIGFKQGDAYGNNFNNGDEALLSDSNRPRDEFGLRINPGRQMDKWDFASTTKNFYLDQITALGGKEITGISGALVPQIIPLGSGTSGYDTLPFSTYGYDLKTIEQNKGSSYTKGNLNWRYTNRGGIIIPESGSYIIRYYSEVIFDPTQGITTFEVALSNGVDTGSGLQLYDYQSKQNASNPDTAGGMTIQDFKAGDELYLAGMHSSGSGKKALYVGTIIIFKLS